MSGLTKFAFLLVLLILVSFSLANAQDDGVGYETRSVRTVRAVNQNASDEKKGSTIRGRVYYQDSGRPVRRGWIGFTKIRELVETPKDKLAPKVDSPSGKGDYLADEYVLTNDKGEFVIKYVKSGVYQPVVKVQGVLNPTRADKDNPLFQQIAVDGLSPVQTDIGIRRGGAISGRIFYSDGEPMIGAKVRIFKKDERLFETGYSSDGDSLTIATTDDRGFYRFAGLPAGEYVVRLTEPTLHGSSGEALASYEMNRVSSISELQTFYPGVSEMNEATAVQIYLGREQTGIDITIPNRQLFKISGTVVAKNNKLPLPDMKISFRKITTDQSFRYSNTSFKTDEQGNWAFTELPKGKYQINVSQKDNYYYAKTDDQKQDNDRPEYASISKEIEIEAENLENIIIELPLEAVISGEIVVEDNKPLPNYLSLFAFDAEKELIASGYAGNAYGDDRDSSGNKSSKPFSITGLSEGNFIISARSVENYYIKSIRLGRKDFTNAPIEIKDGEKVEGVQIVLATDVGTLKGRVNNIEEGNRTFVVMFPVGTGVNELKFSTNSTMVQGGVFELKVKPGEYYVIVGTDDNRPKPSENLDEAFAKLIKDAPKVTVKPNETTQINLDYPTK